MTADSPRDSTRDAATLSDMVRARTALTPDAQYFTLFDDTVTYRRLWEQSGRYAAGLHKSGVRPGDKVCLIYPTCAEFFYTFFGCLRLGAVPVPLYPTLGVEATGGIFRDEAQVTRRHADVDGEVELAATAVLAPVPEHRPHRRRARGHGRDRKSVV